MKIDHSPECKISNIRLEGHIGEHFCDFEIENYLPKAQFTYTKMIN